MNTPTPQAKSDTPRTDAAPQWYHSISGQMQTMLVHADFARTLERELSAAHQQLKDMTDQFFAVSQENAALRTHGLWSEQSSPVANPERGNATGQGK